MKFLFYSFFLLMFLSPACDTGTKEDSAPLKAAELLQKEQELIAREQLIEQKEQELAKRGHVLDSALKKIEDSSLNKGITDTLLASRPYIPGLYNVTMKCTKTNCTGSAVGDTKNEQWNIAFEQHLVVIRALSDKKLVRIYKGNYLGGGIELEAQPDSLATLPVGRIFVRLQETRDKQLDGVREITRQDDCRIIYDLDLKKVESSAL